MKAPEKIYLQICGSCENDKVAPATFPIQLAKDMIYTYTEEGMTVYDPFAGSGTTNLAAYELGRGCIGTEIVEDYAVVASRRLSMAMKQQRLSFA